MFAILFLGYSESAGENVVLGSLKGSVIGNTLFVDDYAKQKRNTVKKVQRLPKLCGFRRILLGSSFFVVVLFWGGFYFLILPLTHIPDGLPF